MGFISCLEFKLREESNQHLHIPYDHVNLVYETRVCTALKRLNKIINLISSICQDVHYCIQVRFRGQANKHQS